jgi:hypothetical protein
MDTFEPGPTEDARRDLLAVSKGKADGGHLIGKDPREVPSDILLRYPGGEKSPEGPSSAVLRLLLRTGSRSP